MPLLSYFMDKFSYLSNAHSDYIESLYQDYKVNPSQIDPQWQKFFEGFEFAQTFSDGGEVAKVATTLSEKSSAFQGRDLSKEFAVAELIDAYRMRGHLMADTNPVRKRKDRKPRLDLQDFGLSEADLNTSFSAASLLKLPGGTLQQVIDKLKKTYQGKVGFETSYVRNFEQKQWLLNKIENEWPNYEPSHEMKTRIFQKLNEAVVFENFLHTKYVGQKRFSLEGGETSIPVLDFKIGTSIDHKIKDRN